MRFLPLLERNQYIPSERHPSFLELNDRSGVQRA